MAYRSYRRKNDTPYAKMEPLADGRIAWKTNYSQSALDAFKAQIPYFMRSWDKSRKAWLVEPECMTDLMQLGEMYHSASLAPINLHQRKQPPLQVFHVKIIYIGSPKSAGGIEYCSGKAVGAEWYRYVFIGNALQNWFEPGKTPGSSGDSTWYAVLGIGNSATPPEIKKAYRICAKTWHPDVNKDTAAPAQFRKVQEAYEGLSNPQTRAKYDAFLLLENSIPRQSKPQRGTQWRPPVRCGQVTINARYRNGYHLIENITAWNAITNQYGETMVSQWDKLQNKEVVKWV